MASIVGIGNSVNQTETLQLLAILTATWSAATFSTPQAEIWHQHLQHFEFRETVEAAGELADTSRWPPSIAEFVTATKAIAKRNAERQASIARRTALVELNGEDHVAVLERVKAARPGIIAEERAEREDRLRAAGTWRNWPTQVGSLRRVDLTEHEGA